MEAFTPSHLVGLRVVIYEDDGRLRSVGTVTEASVTEDPDYVQALIRWETEGGRPS